MRVSTLLLAAFTLPLAAGPNDGFVDAFQSPEAVNRRLMRGDWKVAGVASVTQDDALYEQFRNHGPIVFYDLPMRDVRVRFQVRLEDSKRFIFTLNGEGGHVFRVMQTPDAGAVLAYVDKDGKHAAVRVEEELPAVRNGEWISYAFELRGDTATVSIGDSFAKTARHPTFAAAKSNLSLSFHFGSMQVRNLQIEAL